MQSKIWTTISETLKFLNALIANSVATQKLFTFEKRNTSNAQKTDQPWLQKEIQEHQMRVVQRQPASRL